MTQPTTGQMKVQLQSMLTLLAQSLYSRPDVCLRELLANAVDALHKREYAARSPMEYAREQNLKAAAAEQKLPADWTPPPARELCVKVWTDGCGVLTMEDNGCGLTADEIVEHLTNIGVSGTKLLREGVRDTELTRKLIGQFGIGFLSCFKAADKVDVITRSIRYPHGTGHKFTCQGNGTYDLKDQEFDSDFVGTRIRLHLSNKEKELRQLFEGDSLAERIRLYGDLLPFPVYDQIGKKLTYQTPPWESGGDDAAYIRHRYQWDPPLLTIPIRPGPSVLMGGVVFIPSQRGYLNRYGAVDLYVKRMLVRQECPRILPEVFTMLAGVVECPELTMVASREDVLRSGPFDKFQKELTDQVVAGLAGMRDMPDTMRRVMATYGVEFKGAMLKHAPLFDALVEHIPFQNAGQGRSTLREYMATARRREADAERERIYYSQTLVGGIARFQVNQVMKEKKLEVLEAVEDLPGQSMDRLLLEKYAKQHKLELALAEEQDDLFKEVEGKEWDDLKLVFSEVVPGVVKKRMRVIASAFDPVYLPLLIFTPKHEGLRKTVDAFEKEATKLDPKLKPLFKKLGETLAVEENTSILVLNAKNPEMTLLKDKINTGVAKDIAIELYHLALEYSGTVFREEDLDLIRSRRLSLLRLCLKGAEKLEPFLCKLRSRSVAPVG